MSPRTYDDKRWILNEDGSYSRRIQPPTEEVEKPDSYYKDIVTTGAAADLADKLGVDLSEVTGTGLHGKITKADVEAAADA